MRTIGLLDWFRTEGRSQEQTLDGSQLDTALRAALGGSAVTVRSVLNIPAVSGREIWNEPIWAQRRIRKVNDSRLLRALQDAAAQRATSVLNLLSKLITYARKKILKGVDSYYEWKKLH